MAQNLLSLRDVTVTVGQTPQGKILVKNIDLDIPEDTIVGLVGGSGSGKTTTGLSILRLLPFGLNISRGEILWRSENILKISEEGMREIRGKDISMVFQEPLNAFNPVFSIGLQIQEVLYFHTPLKRKERQQRVLEILKLVGLPDPNRIANYFPHQLSGGMRQRAMIAQAIAADPKLIIADEPTSNLDVTLQAKIMELFQKLKEELGLSILLITHDLGMVKHLSQEVHVMHQGKIVEYGKTENILAQPQHDYTRELMRALGV